MTVTDPSRRAREFEYIPGESSDLAAVLEQTRRVAPADSTVFSHRDHRGKFAAAVYRQTVPIRTTWEARRQ